MIVLMDEIILFLLERRCSGLGSSLKLLKSNSAHAQPPNHVPNGACRLTIVQSSGKNWFRLKRSFMLLP